MSSRSCELVGTNHFDVWVCNGKISTKHPTSNSEEVQRQPIENKLHFGIEIEHSQLKIKNGKSYTLMLLEEEILVKK